MICYAGSIRLYGNSKKTAAVQCEELSTVEFQLARPGPRQRLFRTRAREATGLLRRDCIIERSRRAALRLPRPGESKEEAGISATESTINSNQGNKSSPGDFRSGVATGYQWDFALHFVQPTQELPSIE